MNDVVDFFGVKKSYLIESLVRRNLKIKYRRSSLGFLWSLIVPLFFAMTYLLLLKFIMRFTVPHYAFMLILGTISWTFFSVSSIDGLESIPANQELSSKVPVGFHSFILSTTVTAFINYILSFPVIIAFALYDGLSISVSYLALPVVLFGLFLISYFFAVVLGVAAVYFRDLRHLFSVMLQLWMYGTPILYPPSMIPENFKWITYVNPLASTFINLHCILIDNEWPSLEMSLVSAAWLVFAFLVSFLLFKKVRYTVLENV
jgi:ABC-2 type transport system permease protein